MKKTFRRLVSLVLALTMALSLAVSASAATEITFDFLTEYGNEPTVVSSKILSKMTYTTNVTNHGTLSTYATQTPVTITSPEKNFCGIIELEPASNRNLPAYFKGDIVPINGTYTITRPGLYLLLDEPLVGGPIKMAIVLEVAEGPAEPVTPGLHNFKKVNTYKAGQYSDVPATHTFSENAKAGYEFGIMQGYGTSFGVSSNITRLASVIIACRLNSYYYNGADNISKTYSGTTEERHKAYAKDHGILCDFDDLSKSATRAEFAAILSSALPDEALAPMNTVADNGIPDVSMDTPYAADIYRLYRAGILNGSDSIGTFYPDSNITRGAACAIATRMCDAALRKSVNLVVDYPTSLSKAITEVYDAFIRAKDSIVACNAELHSGNFSKNSDAYAHYQSAADTLKVAAGLCSSHAALKEVKGFISAAADALYAAIPANPNINSPMFFSAMKAGLQKGLVPMQKAAPLLTALLS